MTEQLVFPSLIDGYVKGLGPLFTDVTRQRLKTAGLDMQKLPPAINATTMIGFMEIIASTAYPGLHREEQLRRLGLAAIRGWQHGLQHGLRNSIWLWHGRWLQHRRCSCCRSGRSTSSCCCSKGRRRTSSSG